jgi:hypothetical protein
MTNVSSKHHASFYRYYLKCKFKVKEMQTVQKNYERNITTNVHLKIFKKLPYFIVLKGYSDFFCLYANVTHNF